jgi:hypothetical protein
MRVVGEINCPCSEQQPFEDPILQRNHSPGRTVLGIIGKDVRSTLQSFGKMLCVVYRLQLLGAINRWNSEVAELTIQKAVMA